MADEQSQSDEKTQSTVAKLTGLAVAGIMAWVAQKVVSTAWKAAAGHKPPKPEDEDDSRLGEVIAAAAITGAVVALSRVLATRGTAKFADRVNRNRLTAESS